jgi:HAE1 family hydrophobic/amphiphilic exporter-1
MTLTELSIKRPTLIVVIFAALGTLGIFSYMQLKYELLPKITAPVVVVTTAYPGASPNEVETSVSKPIEEAISSLDKIDAIHTTSAEGVSFVTVEFLQSADIDVVVQDAQRKVDAIVADFPYGVKSPVISKIALDEIPVLRMGITSTMPSTEFYQYVKDHIQPQLSNVAGVGQITLVGGDEREIRVNVDAQKLRSYGLSILQVAQVVKSSNLDFPTGDIKDRDGQFVVRVAGKFNSVEDLRRLVIGKSRSGGNIFLENVAEVQDGKKDLVMASRINGITSIGILVQKQTDANAVEVSQLLHTEIKKIEAENENIKLKFDIAQDSSTFTVEAADAVMHDLMAAILLVALVMLIFLHSIRNSLIVMIAIPASLVSTMIAVYAFGFTLNLMTLLAMSLVIGILVDDSIVVLENIYRHLEHGEEPYSAALKGRNEIGFAALSITLVDVVVFAPLTLITGLIGNIVREYAAVVVVSTLMSLFVSFTITPALASRFTRLEHLTRDTLMGRFGSWFESSFSKVGQQYKMILQWALHHRGTVAVGTIVLFVMSLALIPMGFIGNEFLAQPDRGDFTVFLELPPGTTIEQTNAVTQQAEQSLADIPEISKIFANVGVSTEGFIGQTSNYMSELDVSLVPKDQRPLSTEEVCRLVRTKIQKIPGAKVRINPIGIFGTANQAPIAIVVSGNDRDSVFKAADMISGIVKLVPGTADVRLSSEEAKPETRIEIDREKLAALGLNLSDVGTALRVALTGDDDSRYRDGPNEYPIRIQFDQFDRSKTSEVGNLTFVNARGQQIELKQFAKIYRANGPTKLQREDRNDAVTVYSQAIGRPSGTIVADIREALAKKTLPSGIGVRFLGDEKNREQSFSSLGLALLAAILFVYMIMVALYNSYVYPFVVLFSIPVAIVGALLALALTMKSLSILSILGIIMLVGLVAKNAILLVDRTNQMRGLGYSTEEAILEAGQTRLRPILMTTVAMVMGMMPIALATGAAGEWKSGLGWALIGGLTSSLLLTLVVVPTVYLNMERLRERVPAVAKLFAARVRKRSRKKSDEPAISIPSNPELGTEN